MSSNKHPELCAMANGRSRRHPTPGCTCPPWRYHPRHPKPTNPDCPTHGEMRDHP